MAIRVKNINGTGENARDITGSWVEYWEEEKGKSANKCLAFDEDNTRDKSKVYPCPNKSNIVGGHVKKVGSSDNKWYILPICSSHNKLDKEFYAREDDLVQASK